MISRYPFRHCVDIQNRSKSSRKFVHALDYLSARTITRQGTRNALVPPGRPVILSSEECAQGKRHYFQSDEHRVASTPVSVNTSTRSAYTPSAPSFTLTNWQIFSLFASGTFVGISLHWIWERRFQNKSRDHIEDTHGKDSAVHEGPIGIQASRREDEQYILFNRLVSMAMKGQVRFKTMDATAMEGVFRAAGFSRLPTSDEASMLEVVGDNGMCFAVILGVDLEHLNHELSYTQHTALAMALVKTLVEKVLRESTTDIQSPCLVWDPKITGVGIPGHGDAVLFLIGTESPCPIAQMNRAEKAQTAPGAVD